MICFFFSTAPVQPITAKKGKNSHCAESNGKKENVESPSDFSNLAKILDFWNYGRLDAPGAPLFLKL